MEDKEKNVQKKLYEPPKVVLLDLVSSEKCLAIDPEDPGPQCDCQPGSGPDEWCDCGSNLVVKP